MAVDSWLSRVGLDRTIIGRDPGVGCRSAAGHWQSSHCHSLPWDLTIANAYRRLSGQPTISNSL